MQQTTFQMYLEHRLGQEFQLEDVFSQTESLLNAPDGEEAYIRREGIAYKSSVAFLSAIRQYVNLLEHEGMLFKPLMFQGRPLPLRKRWSASSTAMTRASSWRTGLN